MWLQGKGAGVVSGHPRPNLWNPGFSFPLLSVLREGQGKLGQSAGGALGYPGALQTAGAMRSYRHP